MLCVDKRRHHRSARMSGLAIEISRKRNSEGISVRFRSVQLAMMWTVDFTGLSVDA
jgi:hypothetical protein